MTSNKSSVQVIHNPIKIITVEGNLNDNKSARKYFAASNGNIYNGSWLIGLKSFSYQTVQVVQPSLDFMANAHCNVVRGYEQKVGASESSCNPEISRIVISRPKNTKVTKNETFEHPTFFVVNNPTDVLELHFSFWPSDVPVDALNVKFQAVLHYFCQMS